MNDFKKCFAYKLSSLTNIPSCLALDDLYCEKEGKCSFFATEEEHRDKMAKSELRYYKLTGNTKYIPKD